MKIVNFARRNVLVFIRDKSSVFFSLLSVLIIIALYALFLGDVWKENMSDIPEIKLVMDSWISAGLLSVIAFTTAMGSFGTMVADKSNKTIKDFYASPMKRGHIAFGYILGSFFVSLSMSLIALALCQIFLLAGGGSLFSVSTLFGILGAMTLSCLMSTSMVFFILSFVNSQNAFGAVSTIIGTLIGFLTGIYMPVGVLPEAIQYFIKIFPVSHAALLLRRIIMTPYMDKAFSGAPANVANEFKSTMGVEFTLGGNPVPSWVSLIMILATILIFSLLSVARISSKQK